MNISTSVYRSIFLFAVAFVCITLFSASSFLYPLNPWDDANVFMTIGKAMLSGELLYRDIFDHKGPVLFFIHELAAWISYKSFLGIYLIEILCYWGFLVYSHKIMRLFSNSWIVMPFTCLIGVGVVTTDFFWFGDSVEELSLPVLSYTLYHMLSYLKTQTVPSVRTLILVGIGMGLVFWMKFTVVVFHFAALIALSVICYRKKNLQDLRQITLWIIAGFLFLSILCILYFISKGTLVDLYNAYFYTNLFQYGGVAANGEPTAPWFFLVKLAIAAVMVLPIAFTKVRRDVRLLIVTCFGLQMLSFALMFVQIYYFLVLFAYAPLAIYFLRNVRATRTAKTLLLLVGILATATSYNFVTLVNGTFHRGIIPIARYVNKHKTNRHDVLTFSSYDTGIYLLTDVLPPNRFFFAPNATKPEIKAEQAECIRICKPKFLVRKTERVQSLIQKYYDMPIPEEYTLVFHKKEQLRYYFLINPKMFLWNLGYTQGLMKGLVDENAEQQNLYLYERKY